MNFKQMLADTQAQITRKQALISELETRANTHTIIRDLEREIKALENKASMLQKRIS